MRIVQARGPRVGVDKPRSALASLVPAGGLPGPEFPCQSAADDPKRHRNSAAGGLGLMISNMLKCNIFFMFRRDISRAKRRFLPAIRESAAGLAQGFLRS